MIKKPKSILFRLESDLHDFIKEEAQKNERSVNGQLTVWAKEKMHEQHKTES